MYGREGIEQEWQYPHDYNNSEAMENKLVIGVGGLCGTGKSSVLYLLKEFLREKGFEVEYKPTEYADFENENDFNAMHSRFNDERIKVIKNKTKIEIKEIQFKKQIKNHE